MYNRLGRVSLNLLLIYQLSYLAGCSNKDQHITVLDPAQTYNESVILLEKDDLSVAVRNFDAIERDYPASDWARKSLMLRGYTLYLQGNFIDAIFATEDFIKQYPSDNNIDYIYYLKALCGYDQIVDIERDQQQTLKTIEELDELIIKFPHSKYAPDAKQKKLYAYNAIAGKEMFVGLSYIKKGELIPALMRYQNVVRNYNDTIFIQEALYRLVEIYHSMGIKDDAVIYAAVLGHNYPASKWYHKAYILLKK